MAGRSLTSSTVSSRIAEHVALMSRAVIGISGAGGLLGVYGAIQLINHGVKHASGWLWLAGGFALALVAQIWTVQRALAQRDAALSALGAKAGGSITAISMQNVNAEGFSVEGVQMNIGGAPPALRHPKRRWFSRVLSEEERLDLADRCEKCSEEALAFLHRPEPGYPSWAMTPEERRAEDEAREAHRAETQQQFEVRFVTRIRDLLNECAEAGYALDQETERSRVVGDIGYHDRQRLAEAIGVVGRRVGRRSKRL